MPVAKNVRFSFVEVHIFIRNLNRSAEAPGALVSSVPTLMSSAMSVMLELPSTLRGAAVAPVEGKSDLR